MSYLVFARKYRPQTFADLIGAALEVFGKEATLATLELWWRVLERYDLERVERDGEVSAIYFDGAFSHGVRKVPVAGDYRVQDRMVTPPPRARIDESMEALIHHFKQADLCLLQRQIGNFCKIAGTVKYHMLNTGIGKVPEKRLQFLPGIVL